MAWRIQYSVIRGEIDNRVKGCVRGKLWIDGLADPVTLELEGNACADLAGCLLEFKNTTKTSALRKKPPFAPVQRGRAGNLSASHKVRAFSIPTAEARAMLKRGEQPPEGTANALYLEWFSQTNGRVIIEGPDFELAISAPAWRLTPDEETQRARNVEAGWTDFVKQLDAALDQQKRGAKDPEAEWNEHDYERFMKECDLRTDKYMELLEKYGDTDDAEEKIAKEMGWDRERDDDDEAQAEGAGDRMTVEEMNRICEEALNEPPPQPDPHREGIDWIRTQEGDLRHPLQHRCSESAMRFWRICDDLGLLESEDDDLHQFVFEFQTTGVKLGGALCGIAQGEGYRDNAFTVAYLKRALDHLHQAQAGLEAVALKQGLAEATLAEARKELFQIREGILKLMDQFRGRNP